MLSLLHDGVAILVDSFANDGRGCDDAAQEDQECYRGRAVAMIPLIFAVLLAQDKGIVEGVVMNALTNEPLRKAHVTLDGGKTRYAVTSGSEGKFRFEGVEPGSYRPEAQCGRFLDADDEPWLEVASGQHVKGVVIKLIPEGVIAGHVVDEDGDPVPGATVGYERSIQVNGRKEALDSQSGQDADGEGYFFFGGLKAGRYHLSASPPGLRRSPERPEDSTPHEEFTFTDDSPPLELAPGAAVRNVEIRMKKSVVFRVRGRVSNFPRERPTLYMQSDSENGWGHSAQMTGDAFEFLGVPPGSYVLEVSPMYGNPSPSSGLRWTKLFCHVPITVADHNVDDVVVELAPGPSIAGTIKMEGGKFEKAPELRLQGGMMRPPAIGQEDGTFTWENLAPQKYWLAYAPPEGDYIKSILLNHRRLRRWRSI
jgi:hypothetical protein